MGEVLSSPPDDSHIGACGLFCTNCGKFKRGRCQGCQLQSGSWRCPVRLCCAGRKITTCARCFDFESPRDYSECPKLNTFMARTASLFTGVNRLLALDLLRDRGPERYLTAKRESGKM
jgi:hypothetical protein